MSKRKRGDTGDDPPERKQRKGFSVGPANLPDGTYRRKTQKIKNDLIQKAKVKKSYAKLKVQQPEHGHDGPTYNPYAEPDDPTRPVLRPEHRRDDAETTEAGRATSNEIHPERQAMLDRPQEEEEQNWRRDKRLGSTGNGQPGRQTRRPKERRDADRPARYNKEFAQAEERKAQLAARQRARDQREKERRAMTKARRPGKDGKQKLGRQGSVLLSRVQRLVGDA